MYGSVKAVINAIHWCFYVYTLCLLVCVTTYAPTNAKHLDSDATFLTGLCSTHADYVTRDAEARSWELRWVLGLS